MKEGRHLIHIRELDGVRGIAALGVFFHHVCWASIAPEQWGPGIRMLAQASAFGLYGVDLFFVLSGFLITSLLIEDSRRPAYYRNFYWKRALRILPLYLLILLVLFLCSPGSGRYVLLSLFFLANFSLLFHISAQGPFWTLAIEEQFYLLWPTVVRKRSLEELSSWAISIGLLCILLRTVAAGFGHSNYIFTFFHCDGLAAGALLACSFEREQRTGKISGNKAFWLAASLAIGIALIAARGLFPVSGRAGAFTADARQTGVTLAAMGAVGLVIAKRGSRWLGVLRWPGLTFFGLISYALYMIHAYVLEVYDRRYGPLPTGSVSAFAIRFFAVLGVSVIASVVSRYTIELPANSLRKYVLKRPAPETGPDVANLS